MGNNKDKHLVMSYHKMRMWVGILGMSLPFALWIVNTTINELDWLNNVLFSQIKYGCDISKYLPSNNLKPSISHFYYTAAGELFVGVLCAVAFFLFCYRGYPKKIGELLPGDSFMTNLAGLCALGVVVFPTSEETCLSDNLRIFVSSEQVGWLHYGFATIFFITLGLIACVNFRRTDDVSLFGKKKSHNFYLRCGWGIFISIIIVGIYSLTPIHNVEILKQLPIVYIFETTALLSFGACWIKKGLIDSD